MFLLSIFLPCGLSPARFLSFAAPVTLIFCIVLQAGPAVAIDGSLFLPLDGSFRFPRVAERTYEPSLHPCFESGNPAVMFSRGGLDASVAEGPRRFNATVSGEHCVAMTGLYDSRDGRIAVLSEGGRATLFESGIASLSSSQSSGRVVLLSKRSTSVPCFRAPITGGSLSDESIDISLWNPGRKLGDASVLNYLRTFLSDMLFQLETEITGDFALLKLGFQEPDIRDGVRCEYTLKNVEKLHTRDSDMLPEPEPKSRFSCISISVQIAF